MATFEEIQQAGLIPVTVRPTEVGQPVRLVGVGGAVREWMVESNIHAEVVGFTRNGSPRLRLTGSGIDNRLGKDAIELIDRCGCAVVVDAEGRTVYEGHGHPSRLL